MKILFTGGGSGGHFYPILSVAKEIQKLSKEHRLLPPKLYFVSDTPYNEALLYDNDIIYKKNSAGKRRLYFSILNFFDLFKTALGIVNAVISVWRIYPDVVFGKGLMFFLQLLPCRFRLRLAGGAPKLDVIILGMRLGARKTGKDQENQNEKLHAGTISARV